MKMYLNIPKFENLQGNINNTNMANMLKISRSQLWRAKSGEPIGEKFIAGFKSAFPKSSMDEFFLTKPFDKSDTTKVTA